MNRGLYLYVRSTSAELFIRCNCCKSRMAVHSLRFHIRRNAYHDEIQVMYFCDFCFSLAELSNNNILYYKSMADPDMIKETYRIFKRMIGDEHD